MLNERAQPTNQPTNPHLLLLLLLLLLRLLSLKAACVDCLLKEGSQEKRTHSRTIFTTAARIEPPRQQHKRHGGGEGGDNGLLRVRTPQR